MKTASPLTNGSQRLYSLDALRGFDMLWIMGLGNLLRDVTKSSDRPFWQFISQQFEHRVWDGFTFWDLIFPLFMVITGVSSSLSIGKALQNGKSRSELLIQVIKRGLILIVLGIIYNNGLQLHPIADIRFPSVLGKIGATYIFANTIFLYANKKMQWVWCWSFLIGYWLLLKFTSAPGYPPGDLTEPGNFMSYLDRNILPGRLSRGIHDTVGLVCTIPGISNVLIGIFAGEFLRNNRYTTLEKPKWLVIAGCISIALAILWNFDFPFNKNLWSSSFVLLTSGISLLLLAIFYFIIDVHGFKRWSFFFRVIGMNSILIYISPIFINWEFTANGLFKWLGQMFGEPYDKVIMAICFLLVQWIFLYILYRKKIFLRL